MKKQHKLLKYLTIFLAAIALICVFSVNSVQAFYQSPQIPLYSTTLRGIGPDEIPVAAPDPFPAPVTRVTHYTINIRQFQDQIVPTSTGLGPTTLWGYYPAVPLFPGPQKQLGGIIVGKKGVPIQITFTNDLPNASLIPIDTTIPGANQDQNRAAVHLHGGHTPWISDGGPFDWFTPDGKHGLSFLNNVLNPRAGINQAEYYYPLDQSARFMWYHDHAWGITRTNAYAGVASALLLRDDFENGLIREGLPNYIERGGFEIPLIFQDKIFVGPDILSVDPTWTGPTAPGSLWYAHTYEYDPTTGRWPLGPILTTVPPDPSEVPEYFGDTMLVNGTAYPETTVQARRYRLRLLNACNARFLNLQLYIADKSPNGITLDSNGIPTNIPFKNAATGSTSFLQIGTEGGFLPHPVAVPSGQPMIFLPGAIDPITGQANPALVKQSLLMAPAERTDVIVDFSSVQPGTKVILYSDAPAPFPSGDDRNDYFPGYNVGSGNFGIGNPVNGTTTPGFGPNTRVLMMFTVVAASGPADLPLKINTKTDLSAGNDPLLVPAGSTQPPLRVFKRFLTLNEYYDEHGRLIQIIGDSHAPYGSPYVVTSSFSPNPPGPNVGATEQNVLYGTEEVWEIYNTTGDVHPMHFHLVDVQLINRQLFDESTFPGTINFTGPVIPPAPNEQGYKDTVRIYPGTVARIIMRFTLPVITGPNGKPITVINRPPAPSIIDGIAPLSPRTGGHEYVWHCHILEHEEHDMMHAMVVW
ncbi:MAG: multicopper oxidase family protein [Syntrophobacteraceae bacterium]|jgi:spore coat protein A, manganese oxidase